MDLLQIYGDNESESEDEKTVAIQKNVRVAMLATQPVNDYLGLADTSDEEIGDICTPVIPSKVASDLAELDLLVNSCDMSNYVCGPVKRPTSELRDNVADCRHKIRTRKFSEDVTKNKFSNDINTDCRDKTMHVQPSHLETHSRVQLEVNPFIESCSNESRASRLPKCKLKTLHGHAACVNKVDWGARQYSHLLLSASVDKRVKIWDVFSGQCVSTSNSHRAAVCSAVWSVSGKQFVSVGYDKYARLTDVETGKELTSYLHPGLVSCVRYHPIDNHLYVTGSDGRLILWDTRNELAVKNFESNSGQVLDVIFIQGGREIVCSNDIVLRDSADRTIMAWDLSTGAILSNQIYQERYTCPSLAPHLAEEYFVAQSNGNYVAQFSTIRPYKMNKRKRYESHKVQGYRVGCTFSTDGKYLLSGSSDGNVYCYNAWTSYLANCLETGTKEASLSVACHPVLDSMIAVSLWDGTIQLWQ